ncbi:MAG: hypothetical protein ACK5II_11230 [Paracoccus sp. (in: a-proteobacteria)]
MSNALSEFIDPKQTPPDIFRAAQNNDVAELLAALEDGQSLSTQDPERLMMTPVHIAAARSSNDFLGVASQHETFNPQIRDANLRVAADHASAYNNAVGHKILTDAMYADLFAPDNRHIDYTDNEPSEFYPG